MLLQNYNDTVITIFVWVYWVRNDGSWAYIISLNIRTHRRSQYEANRGTRLGKILSNTVDFYFFIRLIILEDFIRLISYNGPCVRLGCSFFLATALVPPTVEDLPFFLTPED